ncbi:MAG TPA: helix-turn-helix domain-containing protein [Beijerinckiaceae bacterium]|nr:helix-turn-helix domain-containing protein [Beijerinckiaceae bacterium]
MKKSPGPVDKHVGSRVRMRRILIGMSQEKLGEALNLTFQQVQKYEKGTNRIGASRLQQIAQVLGVPVTYLFEGAPQERSDGDVAFAEPRQADYSFDLLSTPDGVQLAKAFMSIEDPKLRRRVVDLVNTLAESSKSG